MNFSFGLITSQLVHNLTSITLLVFCLVTIGCSSCSSLISSVVNLNSLFLYVNLICLNYFYFYLKKHVRQSTVPNISPQQVSSPFVHLFTTYLLFKPYFERFIRVARTIRGIAWCCLHFLLW